MMSAWSLMQGDLVLGELTETERDMWNVRSHFVATGHFSAFRSRFERKSFLAEQLEDSEEEALEAEFNALEEATSPPSLRLIARDGTEQPFGLLYVDGEYAGFRLLL